MGDEFEEVRAERLTDMLFGGERSTEEWDAAMARWEELDVAGDGKFAIRFGGPPREFDVSAVCPDCGQIKASSGVSFEPVPDDMFAVEFDVAQLLSLHWSLDCPAWKHRKARWRSNVTWRLWGRRRHTRKVKSALRRMEGLSGPRGE